MKLPTIALGCLLAFQSFTVFSAAPAKLKRENDFDLGWHFLKSGCLPAQKMRHSMTHPGGRWTCLMIGALKTSQPPRATPLPLSRRPRHQQTRQGGGRGRGRANFPVVGPFSPESPGGTATGYTLGGTSWGPANIWSSTRIPFGRRRFRRRVRWRIHGRRRVAQRPPLGNHPYGYTAFAYDLTRPESARRDNVLAVRVRNLGKNSRWYSGSGIYRHVCYGHRPAAGPALGRDVTTPQVAKERATVNVVTTVKN